MEEDPTNQMKKEVDAYLQEAEEADIIDSEIRKALTNECLQVPLLYLVPKVHKDLKQPPGRPIVSGVDSFLQDIVGRLPNCLKDTYKFLRQIDNCNVTDVTWLCTLDVQSLYTNIPLEDGCKAVIKKLCENDDVSYRQISFIMYLLDIILTRNYFRFGQDFYLQLQGTSMESPVAPSYANIFMTATEQQNILNSSFSVHIKKWLRYVDDVFLLWSGTEAKLCTFVQHLSTMYCLLKFTLTKREK